MPSPDAGFSVSMMRCLGPEAAWYLLQASVLHRPRRHRHRHHHHHANASTGAQAAQAAQRHIARVFDLVRGVEGSALSPRERHFLYKAILAGAFDGVRLFLAAKGLRVADTAPLAMMAAEAPSPTPDESNDDGQLPQRQQQQQQQIQQQEQGVGSSVASPALVERGGWGGLPGPFEDDPDQPAGTALAPGARGYAR